MLRSLSLYANYAELALTASRRTPALTVLIVLAIAIGIGTCMSMLTLYRAMSRDPIPSKSAQLFVPQIETRPPTDRPHTDELPDQLTYRDSQALLGLPIEVRQASMYPFGLLAARIESGIQPFRVEGRATTATFFSMFDAPFLYGGGWDNRADAEASNAAVISARLNDRIFGGIDSVGQAVSLGSRDYRVVGVLRPWKLAPRLYDLVNGPFSETEDVFIPLETAIRSEVAQTGLTDCPTRPEPGWQGFLNSDCLWIQHWAELPSSVQLEQYGSLLQQYASDQQSSGRFAWSPSTAIHDARDWLEYKKVVSGEIRVFAVLGFGFLIVCLLNAVGLILAKFESRASEFGIRRTLGATRMDVLTQCLIDAAAIGAAGGAAGLLFVELGLRLQRLLLPSEMQQFAYLDGGSVGLVIGVALIASLLTALYPAWLVSRVQPTWESRAD